MTENPRNYGLGTPMKVVGKPVAKSLSGMPCPNCGCETLFEVTVDLDDPRLGGKGMGVYIGCPACPFASPMVSRSA